MKYRLLSAILLGLFTLASVIVSAINPTQALRNPLSQDFSLVYPSFAVKDGQGNLYVIDKSLAHISKISPEGELVYEIHGNDRSRGKLFYAIELAVDEEGNLFVMNQVVNENGFFTEREDILRFDPKGTPMPLVYSRDYKAEEINNNNVNRGRLSGLAVEGNILSFYELSKDGAIESTINTDTWRLEQRNMVPDLEAAIWLSSIKRFDEHSVVYVSKAGKVYHKTYQEEPVLLYDGSTYGSPDKLSIPWWIGVDDRQGIYVSDMARSQIIKLPGPLGSLVDPVNNPVQVMLDNSQYQALTKDVYPYIYYTFAVDADRTLVTTNDIGILVINTQGKLEKVVSGGKVPLGTLAIRWMAWLGLASGLAFLVNLVSIVYLQFMKRRVSLILKQLLILLPLVTFILVFVSVSLIGSFTTRYEAQEFYHISQAIQVISQVIDIERLKKIEGPDNFMDADYQFIRNQMHRALNYNRDPWNNKFYFALHRTFQNKLFTMMYLNDGVGPLHPFSYLNDPTNTYWKAMSDGITTAKAADQWGTWAYGVGPIVDNEGHVVALLEVGRDQYGFQQETNRLLGAMIPFVVGSFIALVFLFFLFTWLFLAPLRSLRSGVGRVAAGQYDTTLPVQGRDEVSELTEVFNHMSVNIRTYIDEVVALSQGYRRFVPQEFLAHLDKESVKEVNLGDQIQREMTILFSDIRSFTTISEAMSPKENFDFLNRYLSLVGPEVRKNNGFIDKYIGDAIMALFPTSPDDAVITAIEIISLLSGFNTEQEKHALAPIQIGIGIHTGNLMLGILGEKERMDGTVISDNVNLASRLEGLTKQFNASILISDSSMAGIHNKNRYLFRYLGKIKVKGKKEPVGIYEILDGLPAEIKTKKVKSQEALEKGIELFQEDKWADAHGYFIQALGLYPDDITARIYAVRCKEALSGKSTADWHGALIMNNK